MHYAGHPVEMDQLVPWAKSKNLKVIEDCAHTIKSKYKGKYLGTWGDIGCYRKKKRFDSSCRLDKQHVLLWLTSYLLGDLQTNRTNYLA